MRDFSKMINEAKSDSKKREGLIRLCLSDEAKTESKIGPFQDLI